MKPSPHVTAVLVLPSLKISGGVSEALRLGLDLQQRGLETLVCSMWESPHESPAHGLDVKRLSRWSTRALLAAVQLPAIAWRFCRWLRATRSAESTQQFVFTHYATLPLAMLVPRDRRWVYVQDLEWRFVDQLLVRKLLRLFVVGAYRRCRLIAANSYLADELKRSGLAVEARAPVWADPHFASSARPARDIDFVMVLRKGSHKRLDLYLDLLDRLRAGHPELVSAVITTEDDIAQRVAASCRHCWVRLDLPRMRSVYARSRCFVHLSDHEGFGLPPLEAMASGCVPYCRDSGGVRAYMAGPLKELLVPWTRPIDDITADLAALVRDADRLARLSQAAQAVFVEGVDAVHAERQALGRLLAAGNVR